MNNLIVSIIYNVLNWSPILHVSVDELFGSVGRDFKKRFSLLAVSLGKRKFYFVSIVQKIEGGSTFEIFHHLYFDSVCAAKSELDVKEKVTNYEKHISFMEEVKIRNQIEFLRDKISMNQSRIASGYNKVNMYIAIVLVYIGFIIYLLGKITSASTASLLLIFLAILSIYYACNCALFIKSALSIKGYIRSSFKSIKDNTNEKVLACAYYRDWYSTSNEGDVITSLVANIEKYFIRSFVMSLLVLGLFSIGSNASFLKNKTTHHQDEYLIFNPSGEFQKSEFILLMEKVNEGDGKVFIIKNKSEKKGSKVRDFIKATLSHPDRVVEVYFENEVVDSNVVIVKYKEAQ